MSPGPAIPDGANAITAEWMGRALVEDQSTDLPAIRGTRVENAGLRLGLLSVLLRCHIAYRESASGAPESVIVKVPSDDPKNRRIGERLALYRREFA